MPRVFISYVSQNLKDVERLVSALKAREIEVWFDRTHLRPGDRWKDVIRREIAEGDFFIACFSAEYSKRDQTFMNEEITQAIDRMRQLPHDRPWFVPVLLSECDIPDREIGAGATLRDLHYAELDEDWEAGIRQIISVLQPGTIIEPQELIAKPESTSNLLPLPAVFQIPARKIHAYNST